MWFKKIIIFPLFLFFFLVTTYIGLGKEIKILEGHRAPISDFTIDTTKDTIVSLDYEGKIKLWSLKSYKVLKNFTIYNAPYFTEIDISPSNRYIALSGDEAVWVYDTIKRSVIIKINGIESKGVFINNRYLTYLRDGYINILDINKQKITEKIDFPYSPPNFLTLSFNKKFMALCNEEYIIIVDLNHRKIIRKIASEALSFSFLGNNRFIFLSKGKILLDNIKGKRPKSLNLDITNINYISGSPYGERIVVLTNSEIYIYKLKGSTFKKESYKKFGIIQKWLFIDEKRGVFLSIGANQLTIVSVKNLSAISNLGGYALPVDKIRFSHSGKFLAIGLRNEETYLFRICNLKDLSFIKKDFFSSSIDFELSKTKDKVAILDSSYDLYIYNLKTGKVEKIIQDVREELLLYRKDLIYTFFEYSNLGIYNTKDGSFNSVNLNSMPFLRPYISRKGFMAILGEDGNIWIYNEKGENIKKISLPDKVKEKLQAEELGITIPRVVFTNNRGNFILSIPEEDGFFIEKIEHFKVIKKLRLKGSIIGAIDNKYLLEEVISKTGEVIVNLLDNQFKKITSIKMGEGLISSYDYFKNYIVIGDQCGNIKFIRLKDMATLTIKIFSDGNFIIYNDKGEFFAGKGIEKYVELTKNEMQRLYKKDVAKNFFK